MKMVLLALTSAGAVITCTGIAAAAQPDLSFATLEYQQPHDPLLPSNQSADIVEHTPQAVVTLAVDQISAAIPAGTPRAAAEAILAHAGAHCRSNGTSFEHCAYSDVETRDEYVDAVRWSVVLSLAGDQVQSLSVDRSWVRS
jgi:hypothetical protein